MQTGADFGLVAPELAALRPPTPDFGQTRPHASQLSSNKEQVAKGEQREELRAVLGQPTVTGLHVSELALDDPEGMLDLGPHLGDDPVDVFVDGIELAALWGLAHDAPELAVSGERGLALGADIALVGPDRCLFAVQQVIPDLAVMDLGGRGLEAVDDAAVSIDTDMGLHAKIPVVALLCRRHLRVARLGLVLGRGRRIDDRRIHQRARAQRDALVGKVRVHLGKQLLGQLMLLQQVAEVEDRCFVRDAVC